LEAQAELHDRSSRPASGNVQPVTGLGHTTGILSQGMVRIVRLAPVSDDGEIPFEALTPPTLTTELAAALAQLVRSALARQAEHTVRAA
jgi:hypothetical protein